MSDLSQDQEEKRASIQKSATILGVIVAVVVGLLALWILGGQSSAIRFGGAIVAATGLGYLAFNASFKSGSKSAACASCGAAFSRTQTDCAETVTASTDKEEREEQEDKSTKVKTWVEDSVDVVETYTCAKCSDVTTKAYTTTKRRDEETVVEPYEAPKKSSKTGKGDASDAKGGSDAGKSGRAGRSRG